MTLFLAGDVVQLLPDAVLDNVSGLGTGKLRESYEAIVAGSGRFFVSVKSSQGRGVTATDLDGKPAEFAPPSTLAGFIFGRDRTVTY